MVTQETADERRERVRQWIEDRVAAEGIPWTPMTKPLNQCRVALVSSAGLYLPSQQPFDAANPDGDWSYREIPNDISLNELRIAHEHYNHSGAEKDMNVVFPLGHFRELEIEGAIGELAQTHYAFMGFIPDPARLVEETAPEVARRLRQDGVEVVFLFPTWPVCNQSVGLIQRAIEAEGITTVSLSLLRGLTRRVRPPRALFVRFPFGHPLGEPGNTELQRRVIADMIQALDSIAEPGTIIELPYRWPEEEKV